MFVHSMATQAKPGDCTNYVFVIAHSKQSKHCQTFAALESTNCLNTTQFWLVIKRTA